MPTHDPSCQSLLKSTRHICLLSAFISQHASDSFGKLKAHVYSCWEPAITMQFPGLLHPASVPQGEERQELGWALGAPWFDYFATSFVPGDDTLFSLQWAPLSLPSWSHSWLYPSLASQGGWGPQSGRAWGRAAADKEWETHSLFVPRYRWYFVQQVKKSGPQHEIDVLLPFPKSWDGSWWLQYVFHLGLLSTTIWFQVASLTTLTVSTTWIYFSQAYTKPHSGLKSENSSDIAFLLLDPFLWFWLYSAKIHSPAMAMGWGGGQHKGLCMNIKKCPFQMDQPFWEPFCRAKPTQLNTVALVRAQRLFLYRILEKWWKL